MGHKLHHVSFQLAVILLYVSAAVADILASCPTPVVKKRTIIESNESIKKGARLIGKDIVDNAKDCYELCCKDSTCNAAIMHYKEEIVNNEAVTYKYCFLFACGAPSVCSYRYHRRYAVIDLGSREDERTVINPPSNPATTTTTTTTTTTPAPTTSVPEAPTTQQLPTTTEKSESCDTACPYDYDPVCGDDGKQYDNKCLFKVAKCKENSLNVAHNGECKPDTTPCHSALSSADTGLLGAHVMSCAEDGTFAEKQCHSSTGYCWCVDPKTGTEIKGSKKGPTEGQVKCGVCHRQVASSVSSGLLGAHVMSCADDGTFAEKQCHSSTGYCWCVDPKTGTEIKGSRKGPTEGQVKCGDDVVVSADHNEESVTVSATDYEEVPEEASLPPPTTLSNVQDDPYYTSERREWPNATEVGACHRALSSVHRGLVGSYVPQCKVDGTYRDKQCHGSTGYCWCVDTNTGGEIVGTKKGPTDGSDELECVPVVLVVRPSAMGSFLSLPLLIALIICIVLFIGVVYRVRCVRRGRAKKLPVDDGDYLINGMYL